MLACRQSSDTDRCLRVCAWSEVAAIGKATSTKVESIRSCRLNFNIVLFAVTSNIKLGARPKLDFVVTILLGNPSDSAKHRERAAAIRHLVAMVDQRNKIVTTIGKFPIDRRELRFSKSSGGVNRGGSCRVG